MKFPETNIFCYRFSLRTGALILGWLGVILSPISVIFLSGQISTYYYGGLWFIVKWKQGILVLILNEFICFIISSYLLNGVYQKIEKNVRIYMYGIVVVLFLTVTGHALINFRNEIRAGDETFRIWVLQFLHIGKELFKFDGIYIEFSSKFLAFIVYSFICVSSFYCKLKRGEDTSKVWFYEDAPDEKKEVSLENIKLTV